PATAHSVARQRRGHVCQERPSPSPRAAPAGCQLRRGCCAYGRDKPLRQTRSSIVTTEETRTARAQPMAVRAATKKAGAKKAPAKKPAAKKPAKKSAKAATAARAVKKAAPKKA